MSDKSSPLKSLVIEINVWVKLPEEENIFTLLRILMQVTLSLSTAWRESRNTYGIVRNEGVNLIPTLRRNLLGDVKIPKVGGSLNGYPQAEVEKWKENFPTTLDEDALNISTDGREEDFLSLNRV
ncbi:hypothetical protein Tco_0676197 [Tanacetum coccineum]